ncbi:transposase [Ruficoccus amylovorans]|uniref:Transposase n=1 Tax=Ruficoccus amylovorans TaxID=1804625 RepID=A0A842HJD0_9BACT|nr:transposase [Ruficoccus amylovorans]
MAKAIDYALGQWSGLEVFLQNGAIDIDNNAVQRAIRPTKLGAKNWLFIGSKPSRQPPLRTSPA